MHPWCPPSRAHTTSDPTGQVPRSAEHLVIPNAPTDPVAQSSASDVVKSTLPKLHGLEMTEYDAYRRGAGRGADATGALCCPFASVAGGPAFCSPAPHGDLPCQTWAS